MVIDSRPEATKQARVTHRESGTPEFWLGDDSFSPDRMTILQSRLHDKIGDKVSKNTVAITSFEIRLFNPNPGIGDGHFVTGVTNSPWGLLGALSAGAMIGAIQGHNSDRSIICEIEGLSEGNHFSARKVVRLPESQVEEGLNEVIRHTIDKIADDILQSRWRPQ